MENLSKKTNRTDSKKLHAQTKKPRGKKSPINDIEIITDSNDELGNLVDSVVEREKAQEQSNTETIPAEEPKKKYFFKFVELPRVKTNNAETLELLKLRISKKRIENDTETASKIFQAIDSEVERLHNVKINQIFLTGAIKISEDIHNKYIQTERITFNQLVCAFNILYGLSKCF